MNIEKRRKNFAAFLFYFYNKRIVLIKEPSNIPDHIPPPTKFTNIQHELLRLYSHNVSDEDLLAIKDLIGRYFMEKLQMKVDAAVEKLGYTQEDFDAILNAPNQ